MLRKLTLALLTALSASQASAQSDTGDSTMELKTGGLKLFKTVEITIESEDITISPHEVRADYVYRNTGDRPLTTYLLFPLPDLEGPFVNVDAGNPSSENFLRYAAQQDGKKVKLNLQRRVYSGEIDMTDVVSAAKVPLNPFAEATRAAIAKLPQQTIDDWIVRGLIIEDNNGEVGGGPKLYAAAWTLKSAYWWKVTFPAGQDVRISHSYVPSIGSTVALPFLEDSQPKGEGYGAYKRKFCLDDDLVKAAQKALADPSDDSGFYENFISYSLTAGNLWPVSVRKFTLTVDKGEETNYVSFCGIDVRKIGPTTLQMTATDFVPDRDLDILLLVPSQAP